MTSASAFNIGQLLLQLGALTTDQVLDVARRQAVLNEKGVSAKFGEVAVTLKYCTLDDVEEALQEQQRFCITDECKAETHMSAIRAEIKAWI